MLNSFEGHLLEKTVRMHTKLLAGMGFEKSQIVQKLMLCSQNWLKVNYIFVIHSQWVEELYCLQVVGVVHKEINLSSPSGITHSHLIVLVRHKQTQKCLQSDPKRYKQISMKF